MIKTVTGEDNIRARFMFKKWFTFRAEFLLMLVTNHLPTFVGQEEGLWRRVKLIEFRRYFAKHERVRGLSDSIVADEAEGILSWAAEGARSWFANGRRLPEVASVEDASAEYRKSSDPLADFLERHVEKTGNKRDVVFHSDLYARYLTEADSEGIKNPYGSKTFSKMLDERFGNATVTTRARSTRSTGGCGRWRR